MSKHTHKGTCQICGRIHAVNNKTGLIAKHGYTVENGWFEGDCSGSGLKPLEVYRADTDDMIASLRSMARERRALTIEHIRTVEMRVRRRDDFGRIVTVTERASNDEQVKAIEPYSTFERLAQNKLARLQREGEHMDLHADGLIELIERRHGQDLYEAKHLEEEARKAKAEKASKPTKASVKRITDRLNRDYEALIDELKKPARIAQDRERMIELGDLPFMLHQYRPAKHDAILRSPEAAAQIALMIEQRNEARASLN